MKGDQGQPWLTGVVLVVAAVAWSYLFPITTNEPLIEGSVAESRTLNAGESITQSVDFGGRVVSGIRIFLDDTAAGQLRVSVHSHTGDIVARSFWQARGRLWLT